MYICIYMSYKMARDRVGGSDYNGIDVFLLFSTDLLPHSQSDDFPFILPVFLFRKILGIVVSPMVLQGFAETIRFSMHGQVGFLRDCVRPLQPPGIVDFPKGFISAG